jgi:transcription-repair coupling factor (superfamily II helicase)
VGGKLRAYAYLTTAEDKALSEIAEKRLKVLGDLDSLGAGFQLASHDLDIRGAGNLLGDEQSGHIARWASSSTSRCWKMRSWPPRRANWALSATAGLSPQITVDAPIMIPEDYVPDLAVRMASTAA